MIRIVLVDDQELVRTGLRQLAEHDGTSTSWPKPTPVPVA